MKYEPTRQLDADLFKSAAKARKSNAFQFLPAAVAVGAGWFVGAALFGLPQVIPAWIAYAVAAVAALLSIGAIAWIVRLPGAEVGARDAWLEIADKYGLTTGVELVDNVPTMAGEVDGRRVELQVGLGMESTERYGDELLARTEYRLELSESWNPMTLAVRGSVYFDESEGVELGEGDVRLYGAVDDEIAEKLDRPDVIDAARRSIEAFDEVRIGHGDIEAEKGGVALSADELGGEVEVLLEIVEIFDDALDDPG